MTSADTAEQSLTFNYGETPHEVIREGLAARQAEYSRQPFSDFPAWLAYIDADHLLTVLDALRKASKGIGYLPYPSYLTEPGRLRISILAALGITER